VKSFFVALLTGVVISLGLFWLMQIMLMSSHKDIKKVEPVNMMDFIRLKREPPEKPKPKKPPEKKVEQVQEKPQPPQRPKTPPKKQPVVQQKTVVKQEQPTPTVDAPKLDIPVSTPTSNAPAVNVPTASPPAPAKAAPAATAKSAASSGVSTGVIPLERFPPKYPMRAAKRHIEGWVKIEFTITKEGAVVDAVVVDAQPAEIFDEAALQAISKWKFKGKIVDGVAVTQRAVQTLQFKLAK